MKRRFGRYTIETSNEDKVFFPGESITKGDLIEYYEEIAEVMLPHIRNRPLSMRRFPDGIGTEGFFQKQVPDYFPDWIEQVSFSKEGGGRQEQVVCNNTASLVYLANQACIEPHVWLSRSDRLRHPDQMVFDLDPAGDDFETVRHAARRLRALLEDLELVPFVKTTGSRGSTSSCRSPGRTTSMPSAASLAMWRASWPGGTRTS